MPVARVEGQITSRGASLRTIARELRNMDDRKVTGILRRRLEAAAAPYPPRVAAAVRAIPVKHPEQSTGLRERIAQCASLATWTDETHREAGASVWMDTRKMLPDYRTLPLYMEGVSAGRNARYDRWRHPVFGRRDEPWKQQDAHPYFFGAIEGLGQAAGLAIRDALDRDITPQING